MALSGFGSLLGVKVLNDAFSSLANGSAARKFLTTDAVQNNPVTDASRNVEHIVDVASSLKATAVAVQSIASIAYNKALAITDQLKTVTGTVDSPSQPAIREYTDSDVNVQQQSLHAAAVANFTNVEDDSTRAMLEDSAATIIEASRHQFMPVRQEESQQASTVNPYVPEIESITVDLDPRRGATDIFYSRLTFNLKEEASQRVRAIRIFRATIDKPVYTRSLPTLSSHAIDRLAALRGRKSQDNTAYQQRLDEVGVPNAVSLLNPIDPYTNQRVGVGPTASVDIPPPIAGRNRNFIFDNIPEQLQHLDPSVSQNVSVLANLQAAPGNSVGVTIISPVLTVGLNINPGVLLGGAQQTQVSDNQSTSTAIVDSNNKLEFKSIAFFALDSAGGRQIGDRVEYLFDDESITYGLGYKYFIVTYDVDMNQSARSTIASIVVEGLRVPARPAAVSPSIEQKSVVLTSLVEDKLVEKFEVYRRESVPNRLTSTEASTISDPSGYTVSNQPRQLLDNNFLLIGESLNPLLGGSTYTDAMVKPGHTYTYRVYSVDVFGNKSESPYETDVFIPDLEQKIVDLRKPTILAEVDATTQKVRVTFGCNDRSVETLRLERRDLTVGQAFFGTPDQPARIIMGKQHSLRKNSMTGERVFNQEQGTVWNGIYTNDKPQQVFIDYSTVFDHTYQYRIVGLDRYGNQTSYDVSKPVMVVRRPFINAPLNLSASLSPTADGDVGMVTISWSESNLDKSAEDLIGDQSILSATQIRTLYQIERKKQGEEIWQRFSLITGTTFEDATVMASGSAFPNYRPPYLDANTTYLYRVQAVQTGAFISNFTEPLQVFVGFPVAAPQNFTLRTPAVYVRPFYVMLNWETPTSTGIVDRWEIQRADVNNYAAARLNLKNPADFANLNFQAFRTVYLESSRFTAAVYNDRFMFSVNRNILTGEHYYMDTMVDFGNTYIYRMRAISPQGQISPWVYRGIKVTSSVFENKYVPTFTNAEKQTMSRTMHPMVIGRGHLVPARNTYSMQPSYSLPLSMRAPRVARYYEDE